MKSIPLMFGTSLVLVALGAYSLKTGILLGGRGRKTKTFLAYPYGALFVAVGLYAAYHGIQLARDAHSFVASCNTRASTRTCVEYHAGTRAAVEAVCAASDTRCPEDNLVGRCELGDRREYIYSDMWERKPEIERPRCEAAGGSWSEH